LITNLPQSGHKVGERFLSLFRPNPSSFVISDRVEATTDKNGKRKASYTTLSRPVTPADVTSHFAGETCLALKPELPDGTCTWAMIDHDHYEEKTCAILREEILMQKLPLHAFPSKSGGLHSAIFFRSPRPVGDVRGLLSNFAAQLGEQSGCEIFPKWVAQGKNPYAIAVPFFGAREEFEEFEPVFCDLPLNEQPPCVFEKSATDGVFRYGLKLPSGVDFGALLRGRLKFNIRHDANGISYEYHGIDGQPCLIQGSLHAANARNPRCSRFLVRDAHVCHQCFDSDCQSVAEPKTRKALQAVGLGWLAI
jgi:hypothetical protein